MNEPSARDDKIEALIERWRNEDATALDALLPLVYADLRRIARGLLRKNPGHATLQTTALVHEAMLRLLNQSSGDYKSSAHLLNASACIMRHILVDRARRLAFRSPHVSGELDPLMHSLELPLPPRADLVDLDQALSELETIHERMARVVELRWFVGLSVAEVAATLGVAERTTQRDWIAAREWLHERLESAA